MYLVPSSVLEIVLDFVGCQKRSCVQSMLCFNSSFKAQITFQMVRKNTSKPQERQKISRKVSWQTLGVSLNCSLITEWLCDTLEGFKDLNKAERLGKFHLWESQFVFYDWQVDPEPGKFWNAGLFAAGIFCCPEENTIPVWVLSPP